MNAVHVRDQKHELTPPRNSFSAEGYCVQARQAVTGLRDKPVTQHDALPNSEVPAKIPARAGPVVSAEASPLSSCQCSYQSSASQNRHYYN
ncbi:hypothetical protein V6N13_004935 [Hibiscus sabdariffa]|uniref:Uncharacterized protein n=1 Tax=Hibiscus sabdariffa TaxID=183260 RepID=A0ABR2S0R0_9ROSI